MRGPAHCFLVLSAVALPSCAGRATQSASVDHPAVAALERFLIPKNYRGPFVAIYEQPSGVRPQWRGDTAIFLVPSNGIIRILSAEPPPSTRTSIVFKDSPNVRLQNFPTCADQRLYLVDSKPRVCWLDYQVLGTGIPRHIVAVITDWAGIPKNYERTSFVYDSVLHRGRGSTIRKWEEPPELLRRTPIG